jgi:hypothetical protein
MRRTEIFISFGRGLAALRTLAQLDIPRAMSIPRRPPILEMASSTKYGLPLRVA